MDLELVQEASGKRKLRRCRAVDQHVLVARGPLGLAHRDPDIAHIGDERPLADIDARRTTTEHPDRHTVVVIATPAARRLEGAPARDYCTGGHELVEELAVDACRTAGDSRVRIGGAQVHPLMQTFPAVAEPNAHSRIGTGDESVEGHGHVEDGRRHWLSFCALFRLRRPVAANLIARPANSFPTLSPLMMKGDPARSAHAWR